jgi:hypothetical protein
LTHPARFLATAAVQSRCVVPDYRRAAVEGPQPSDALTEALPTYRGPQLIDLLTELVDRRLPWIGTDLRGGWATLLLDRAKATLTPTSLVEWIRRTRDERPVAAAILVGVLSEKGSRAEIAPLFQEEAVRPGRLAEDYEKALVSLAWRFKSTDAVPMLLRIYRENGAEGAANTLREIQDYVKKLRSFEARKEAEDAAPRSRRACRAPMQPCASRACRRSSCSSCARPSPGCSS